jgi:hypothetical protein
MKKYNELTKDNLLKAVAELINELMEMGCYSYRIVYILKQNGFTNDQIAEWYGLEISDFDTKTIMKNGYDLIALTMYEGGEPVRFTKSDKELNDWLKESESHSWFGVNYENGND